MSHGVRHRGQPVWAMAAVLGAWIAMRVVLWDAVAMPQHAGAPLLRLAAVKPAREVSALPARQGHEGGFQQGGGVALSRREAMPDSAPHAVIVAAVPTAVSAVPLVPAVPMARVLPLSVAPPSVVPASALPPSRPALAAAHQLMWMAAVANLPMPQELITQFGASDSAPDAARRMAGPNGVMKPIADISPDAFALTRVGQNGPAGPQMLLAGPPARPAMAPLPRWSADGWLLLRRGRVPAVAMAGPSYGAAQAGAVLRYRLAPASALRPTAYVAGYAALNGSGERQVAAGLSLRPLPGLPIAAMAEMRASRFANGALHARPAAILVSEFAPVSLPGGLQAEAYVQGGYVGGRAATGFVDGQFRLDRSVLPAARRHSGLDVRVGAGVWGGQQEGSSRLDIGPSVTIGLAGGGASARLAADWRFRIAGNAAPGSGPALTISAGF